MSAVPTFALFVGGAHKCGTTALFRALGAHPALAAHAQSEFTFFVDDEEHAHGLDSRAWRRYVPRDLGARRFVGKHVKLLYRRVALERLRAHSPEVELVLVLRHPVERAHSAFWHARASGREELGTFEEALAAEERRLGDGRAPWHDTMYVRNGLYAAPLADAFAVFGRARVHVHLLEELRADAPALLRAHFARLGVDASFVPDLERGVNRARAARSPGLARLASRVFESRARSKRVLRALVPDRIAVGLREGLARWNARPLVVPPLAADTRARLLERFAASNARVAELLGRELAHWDE